MQLRQSKKSKQKFEASLGGIVDKVQQATGLKISEALGRGEARYGVDKQTRCDLNISPQNALDFQK